MARSYTDAVGLLVRYLIRNVYGMAEGSVRPANQGYPVGAPDVEFATVLITEDDGDIASATRRAANYAYPAWSVATAYTVGTKVTYSGSAYMCAVAVTGGAGPATDTTHWTATTQATQVTETLDVYHEFTASVQFFHHASPVADGVGAATVGTGAFDKASRLQSVLMLSTSMELMERLGLMFLGASQARNLAGLVDGAVWEDRGSVDLYFGCSTNESVLLETIASADIGLKAQWPSGHVDTKTIEVPS